MKKTLLTLFVFTFTVLNIEAQTRLVLFEEFTGENCPPCAATNPVIWSLFQSGTNPSHIFMIKYMVPIPSAGPFYNSNPGAADPRASYYSCPFAPYARMDGIVKWTSQPYPGYPTYLVQGDIDSNAAVPPAFTISARHRYLGDSVYITVDVSCLSALTGNLKLRAAFVRTMNFPTAPGGNGEKDFENVVRNMYPDANGTSLASTWTVSQTGHYTLKGARFKEPLSGIAMPDSNIVVWIQDDNDKTIKQAAVATPATDVANIGSMMQQLDISPNPATNNIVVRGKLPNVSGVSITLINAIGQTVLEKGFTTTGDSFSETIPLDNLSSGIYFVRISSNGEMVTKKITVNK